MFGVGLGYQEIKPNLATCYTSDQNPCLLAETNLILLMTPSIFPSNLLPPVPACLVWGSFTMLLARGVITQNHLLHYI